MGCSGLTLSRSILSLSDSWRNSAVGMCDAQRRSRPLIPRIPLNGHGPNLIQESRHVSHHSPP